MAAKKQPFPFKKGDPKKAEAAKPTKGKGAPPMKGGKKC